MKLQVISEYYYPDNFKINEITSFLKEDGGDVSVLTGLPDYTTTKIPKEYRFFKKRKENIEGVKVRRVPTIARRTGIFFRMLNYFSFALTASVYALVSQKEIKDIDSILVYQLSPIFQVIPGIIYKKRTRKKLVIYCLDLWPESVKAWGMKESNIIFKIVKQISIWCYNKADTIAISSIPFRDYLTTVCKVENSKIVYLPQHATDEYADIVGKYEKNNCVDFLFSGNLGAVQDIDVILKAISEIKNHKNFHVHIVGNGSEYENLVRLSDKLKITKKITFHGRYPADEMEPFYKMADCFLLTLRGGDAIGKTLPGKVQTYLSVGKPIVGAIDEAGYNLIKEADCGEVVRAGDYVNLAKKMELIIENFEYYQAKGLNGRQFYEDNFTMEHFIKGLKKILNEGVTHV